MSPWCVSTASITFCSQWLHSCIKSEPSQTDIKAQIQQFTKVFKHSHMQIKCIIISNWILHCVQKSVFISTESNHALVLIILETAYKDAVGWDNVPRSLCTNSHLFSYWKDYSSENWAQPNSLSGTCLLTWDNFMWNNSKLVTRIVDWSSGFHVMFTDMAGCCSVVAA